MSEAKIAYPIDHIRKGPNFNGCADVQALIRSLDIAYQRGALFFLAAQLAPLLEEHCEKNGAISTVELEILITQAIKVMASPSITQDRATTTYFGLQAG
jgi:hypothetical protein